MPAILKLHIVYVFENGSYKFEYVVIFITEEIFNLNTVMLFCKKQQARELNISLNITVAKIRTGLHPFQVRIPNWLLEAIKISNYITA